MALLKLLTEKAKQGKGIYMIFFINGKNIFNFVFDFSDYIKYFVFYEKEKDENG